MKLAYSVIYFHLDLYVYEIYDIHLFLYFNKQLHKSYLRILNAETHVH